MFQHILVPVDCTDKNQRALDAALKIAGQNRSKVTLLHVIETIENIPFGELKSFYQRLEKAAQEKLQAFATKFLDQGIEVQQKIAYGKRADEIVKISKTDGANLVVLSSHKIDLEQPGKDWGTLSYKVSILSPCPVLLVK